MFRIRNFWPSPPHPRLPNENAISQQSPDGITRRSTARREEPGQEEASRLLHRLSGLVLLRDHPGIHHARSCRNIIFSALQREIVSYSQTFSEVPMAMRA